MKTLAECPWFKGAYRKVYDIVSIGNRLPRAEEIAVLDPDDFRPTKESVMACAAPEERWMWFRHQPPALLIFAHEVIHLARKELDPIYEEVYGYNLAEYVVHLAEKGIDPPANPLVLFERVTPEMVLEAFRNAGVELKDLGEIFEVMGVMPPEDLAEIESDGGRIRVRMKNLGRDTIIYVVTSIVSAALSLERIYEEVVTELLKMCSESNNNTGLRRTDDGAP